MKRSEFLTLLATPFLAFLPKTVERKYEPSSFREIIALEEFGERRALRGGLDYDKISAMVREKHLGSITDAIFRSPILQNHKCMKDHRGNLITFPLEYKT